MTDGFGLDHLPYGVFSTDESAPRVGVRVGDTVVDVSTLRPELDRPGLGDFMGLGPDPWTETRERITELVEADRLPAHPLRDVALHLPFRVGDYVDFYASLDHASNVGRIFRPDQEPLLPNWRHLPVGYHGRGGTVVVSGTPIVRPCGQRKAPTEEAPTYGPSRRLDIEAELGFVVGVGSELGSRIGVDDFARHVVGVGGLNDWSARDIQAWGDVPLGPVVLQDAGLMPRVDCDRRGRCRDGQFLFDARLVNRSPVKTRPVRLPPWAAGASPTMRIRAAGSPNPGTGRAQYGSAGNRSAVSPGCP